MNFFSKRCILDGDQQEKLIPVGMGRIAVCVELS
jgi:hypothetical protein